jgi:hypothetical protein
MYFFVLIQYYINIKKMSEIGEASKKYPLWMDHHVHIILVS